MTINEQIQRTVVDILMEFRLVNNIDDMLCVIDSMIEKYDLYRDPITGHPCTQEEWHERHLRYETQTMNELYDFGDGFE